MPRLSCFRLLSCKGQALNTEGTEGTGVHRGNSLSATQRSDVLFMVH